MRPVKIRDPHSHTVHSPDDFLIGMPGAKFRRMLRADPLEDGPRRIRRPQFVGDAQAHALADPGGVFVGTAGQFVMRCLDARWVGGSRGLR